MTHVSSDAIVIERERSSHELESTLAMRRQQAMQRHWAQQQLVAGVKPRLRVQAVISHGIEAITRTTVV